MICCKCGRRIARAAATIPAGRDHPEGPVGPGCARKHGLLAPPRPRLFVVSRKRPSRAASRHEQLALTEAA